MRRKLRKLWREALDGDSDAYRKLGIFFIMKRKRHRNEKLARLCLEKSAEMGNEAGYLAYHNVFSKGAEIIDDFSYRDMCRDYREEKDPVRKRNLEKYLRLGTERQRKMGQAELEGYIDVKR